MANDLGHVTSATFSPELGHAIGLALLSGGASRTGETLRAWNGLGKTDIEVEVCAPCFIDPEGVRLRG